MHGTVSGYEQELEPNIDFHIKGLVRVQDMIPFGGSSGSPIIDQFGKVVGVESGRLLRSDMPATKPIEASDYAGSVIAPLAGLTAMIENQAFTKLPLSN